MTTEREFNERQEKLLEAMKKEDRRNAIRGSIVFCVIVIGFIVFIEMGYLEFLL